MIVVVFCILQLLRLAGQSHAKPRDFDGYDEEITFKRPWQNPLQELHKISPVCNEKISGFNVESIKQQSKWQRCIDEITLPATERFPVLEARNNAQEDAKINSSVIYEIDRELHMIICQNTSAYKSCWSGIIQMLNKCDPGSGDVAGKLYYALYDDICREGGKFTVESRRKAMLEGKLCERDYSIGVCRANVKNMTANNLCLRFYSNVKCDLSSIDPNCNNKIDKNMHADIFSRVGKLLGCPLASSAVSNDAQSLAKQLFQRFSKLQFLALEQDAQLLFALIFFSFLHFRLFFIKYY